MAYFAAQFTLQNPDSTVSLVTSLVPFTAPLVQPLRYGAGVIGIWEVPVAIIACLTTIALLVPVAARFYAGGALRFGGRLTLREVWRSAERCATERPNGAGLPPRIRNSKIASPRIRG